MSFPQKIADAHNILRIFHNAPLLKVDDKLNAKAAELVDVLLKGKKIHESMYYPTYNMVQYTIKYRDRNRVVHPGEVVLTWYDMRKKHNFQDNSPGNPASMIFAQIVWKDTTHVGAARGQDSDGKWCVVAVYQPPGCIPNKFLENVEDICTEPPKVRIKRPQTPEEMEQFKREIADYEAKRQLLAALNNELKKEASCVNMKSCYKWICKKK